MYYYGLNVDSESVGAYFSSEQIDLLSIIQCKTSEELVEFVSKCSQLNQLCRNDKEKLKAFSINNIELFKREVFNYYQDTLVFHDASEEDIIHNMLSHCNLGEEDIKKIEEIYIKGDSEVSKGIIQYIKNAYPNDYDEIFKLSREFVSRERDQIKSPELYAEMVFLNDKLENFGTLLVGSGKIYNVVSSLNNDMDRQYNFYFAKRDLDFALRNNKHVRYHSLLVKDNDFYESKSKEEILDEMREYVKESIDFIIKYNDAYKLKDGTPVITSVDLFNEIVSFSKNAQGEYFNIWEEKGISIDEILDVFKYARKNKPVGLSFLYNEPFLEDTRRRNKVIETLNEIQKKCPGLIDTLGSQMHITIRTSDDSIKECFEDFKKLQSIGYKIQITEFDMSVGKEDIPRIIGKNPEISTDKISEYKESRISRISEIINESSVELSGLTYWSTTDTLDHNLEREKTIYIKAGRIEEAKNIINVHGGLYSLNQKAYVNEVSET